MIPLQQKKDEKAPLALILAAGLSKRFGEKDKLMACLAGRPLLRHMLGHVKEAGLRATVSVASPEAEMLVKDYGFQVVWNAAPERGMGHSLALLARAAEEEAVLLPCVSGYAVFTGDMPFLNAQLIGEICREWQTVRQLGATACLRPVSQKDAQPGHPVIFGPGWRADLCQLSGGEGAQHLIQRAKEKHMMHFYETSEDGYFQDIDTEEDLQKANRLASTG